MDSVFTKLLRAIPTPEGWREKLGAAPSIITPSTAPSPPANGWRLYCDSGDGNKLKAIASNGTVATLGTP